MLRFKHLKKVKPVLAHVTILNELTYYLDTKLVFMFMSEIVTLMELMISVIYYSIIILLLHYRVRLGPRLKYPHGVLNIIISNIV